MKLRTFLSTSLILVGSMTAVAQSRHPMFDPLFAISYDPQRVHFDLASASIGEACRDLRGRKLWVYAAWTSGETKSFNADDRLSSETYDANGNTLSTGGKTFIYDAENRLVSMNGGAVTLVYDAFGNRVSKTVNGVTTKYLVEDDVNPTGYPQVMEEIVGGPVARTYTYGLQRISQDQLIGSTWTPNFYGYDGGGTVRQLTNSAGTITDTYDYDAFGNEVNHTGTTPNSYLYRAEQYDSDLSLYYLRARYYNPATGRFLSRDPEEYTPLKRSGSPLKSTGKPPIDPKKLHKYLYAIGDPVNRIDPRGREDEEDEAGALEESENLVEEETYKLKTLARYQIQQSWGVEEGESAEDAVPGGNIDITGSDQYLRNLIKGLVDWWEDE